MRWALSFALLAACSFHHGVDNGSTHDANEPGEDSDLSIDAPNISSEPDAALDAHVCPNDFVAVTGGQPTSRYKFYGFSADNTVVDFNTAKTTCTNAGGYLAIPNDASELAAFDTIAQNPSQAGYWIGITDAAVEGTWRTIFGDPAPYLPWKAAQPNGGIIMNCAVGYLNELYDVDCAMATYVFVCECS